MSAHFELAEKVSESVTTISHTIDRTNRSAKDSLNGIIESLSDTIGYFN